MNIFTLIHIRLFPPPNFFSPYEAAKCEYPTYRHFVPHNGWAHGTISRVNCWVSDESHQCALWLFGNNCNILRKKKQLWKRLAKSGQQLTPWQRMLVKLSKKVARKGAKGVVLWKQCRWKLLQCGSVLATQAGEPKNVQAG